MKEDARIQLTASSRQMAAYARAHGCTLAEADDRLRATGQVVVLEPEPCAAGCEAEPLADPLAGPRPDYRRLACILVEGLRGVNLAGDLDTDTWVAGRSLGWLVCQCGLAAFRDLSFGDQLTLLAARDLYRFELSLGDGRTYRARVHRPSPELARQGNLSV